MSEEKVDSTRIVIIGAGMSGICMGLQLLRHGYTSIELLESSDDVGGTWLVNHYPNAACDIPSWLYSFSFAPNYDWSHKFARQPEILQYFQRCAYEGGLQDHISFGVTVSQAAYDESTRTWTVDCENGESRECDILISAVGQLNRPSIPQFETADAFTGESFHSARWNHDVELTGKRVAVIGTGASAIQFVPEVARQAERLYLFQRTPPWVDGVRNFTYPGWAKWILRNVPGAAAAYRLSIFLECESGFLFFREGSLANRLYARKMRHRLRKQVPEELLEQLTPDYAPGCKRILKSDEYLDIFNRSNVELVAERVQDLDEEGIVSETRNVPVDVVIYGTGFEATKLLQPMTLSGRDAQTLHEAWANRPRTLLGMATPGFPNLFMLYGPNTNLGHNSIIAMVESQVSYILACLRHMRDGGHREVEVRRDAVASFDHELQNRLSTSVWAGDCSSWYKTADGTLPNNWWGAVTSYLRRTRRPDYSQFDFSG